MYEKFEILTYPNQDELLNKRLELVLNVALLTSIYCPTIKQMIDIPFNAFHIIILWEEDDAK